MWTGATGIDLPQSLKLSILAFDTAKVVL